IINSYLNAASCGGLGGIARDANSMTINNVYVRDVEYEHGNSAATGGIAYEGNNVSISNSYVENAYIESPSVGGGFGFVFANLNNSNVENVYVKNSSIENVGSSYVAAGFAGTANNSIFRNSYTENISITGTSNITFLSGFIGRGSGFQIYDSYVRGLVINGTNSTMAGLISSISGGSILSNVIERSGVKNSTITNNSSTSGLVGGLIANLDSNYGFSISDSYFVGDLEIIHTAPVAGMISYTAIDTEINANRVFVEANIINHDSSIDRCFIGNTALFATVTSQDNFYNSDVCVYGSEHMGSPLTTTQMKDSTTSYTNWNINTPSCSGADDTNPWRWTAGNYPCLYSDSTCTCS
ncbi:MAG: hypothetical protein WC280_00330, partial [Patescibacteria group bacterium]